MSGAQTSQTQGHQGRSKPPAQIQVDESMFEIDDDEFDTMGIDNVDEGDMNNNKKKHKRKRTSVVWRHFKVVEAGTSDGKDKAMCIYCKAEYICDSRYGTDSFEFSRFNSKLQSLFEAYKSKSSNQSSGISVPSNDLDAMNDGGASYDTIEAFKEFDEMSSNEFGSNAQKSQLERYLEEPKMPRNVKLDILAFWKSNQFRYPDLASMARDILSIPVSTVVSEACFSIGGRVLDQYRSSLKPDIAEAIICLRDWIAKGRKGRIGDIDLKEITDDIFNLSVNESPSSTTCSNSVGN